MWFMKCAYRFSPVASTANKSPTYLNDSRTFEFSRPRRGAGSSTTATPEGRRSDAAATPQRRSDAHYLGESAETADTAEIVFELTNSAASARMLPLHASPMNFAPGSRARSALIHRWFAGGGGLRGVRSVALLKKCPFGFLCRFVLVFYWKVLSQTAKNPSRGYMLANFFFAYVLLLLFVFVCFFNVSHSVYVSLEHSPSLVQFSR
jgi:hypothetical protein